MNRICFFFICGLFSAALFVPRPYAQDYDVDRQGHRAWRIGIVTDGSTPADQAIVGLFKKEISAMMEQEFDVCFPENMILSGKDTGR